MDGFGKTLFWFSEENLTLEVPFFQRPYVWDEDNWGSLINSIQNASDKSMPFIGSFILQEKENNNYWVIDGQQRITTLTILIKSLLDYYKDLNPQVRTLYEGIIYRSEVADIDNIINIPRLVPAYIDKGEYDIVISQEVSKDKVEALKTNIARCYLYFYNYFESLSVAELKDFASKLLTKDKYVIAITLDSKDDEQAIFDTVNSLGKRLTNSDIIKNFLYQQMKSAANGNEMLIKQVLSHYKKYWEEIFYEGDRREFWDARISLGRITTTHLDAFLKDYGTIKKIYIPSESGGFDGLAKQYKSYILSLSNDELIEFSKELSSYANTYYEMKSAYMDCNDFRIRDYVTTTLLILDKLEISTFNPYILQLYKLNESDRDSKLLALQRFVLKRFLWKATIKNYNKCCLSLLESSNPNSYLDSYNDQTIDVDWTAFPSGVKHVKNNQGTLLLFIIEMIRRSKKGEDNYSDTLLYNKTLEHVLPQKWEKNWLNVPCYDRADDGQWIEITEYEEVLKQRRAKIYSLGNMTLLASKLNTSISNEAFKYKIEGKKEKGIKYFVGTLSVAQEIVDSYNEEPNWDERKIIERESVLLEELKAYYKF